MMLHVCSSMCVYIYMYIYIYIEICRYIHRCRPSKQSCKAQGPASIFTHFTFWDVCDFVFAPKPQALNPSTLEGLAGALVGLLAFMVFRDGLVPRGSNTP